MQEEPTSEMYVVIRGNLMAYESREVPAGMRMKEMKCSVWADISRMIHIMIHSLEKQKKFSEAKLMQYPGREEFHKAIKIIESAIEAATSAHYSTNKTLRHDLEDVTTYPDLTRRWLALMDHLKDTKDGINKIRHRSFVVMTCEKLADVVIDAEDVHCATGNQASQRCDLC